MLSNGYIHPRNEHTKPAGIWRKLQTLYDLDALDEREDARQLSDLSIESSAEDEEDDVYSEAANKIHKEDFSLPDEEFGEMKWQQRFMSEEEREREGESPPVLPELNLAEERPVRFTPSFSVEPSEAATPSRGGRARAGTARGRGRPATVVAALTGGARRSARQAESVAGGSEQDEEAENEDEEASEEDDEQGESEESTPAARSTRTGRGRGRSAAAAAAAAAARGRGRGRGRGK